MGEDVAYIAEQLGHADTSTTHRIYTRVMRLDAAARGALRRLVSGADWAQVGANQAGVGETGEADAADESWKLPSLQAMRVMGTGGFEPPTSRV